MLGYFNKKDVVALFAVLAVCLAAGSAFDYQISLALFDPTNLFGRTIEAMGELPFEIVASVAGVMLVRGTDRERRATWWLAVAGVALNAVLAGYEVTCALRNDGVLVPVVAVASIAVTVAANVIVYRLTREASRSELLRWAAVAIAVCAVQLIILNAVIKPIWSRPRMRVIAVTPGLEFQPWWVIGHPGRDSFIAAGVIRDGFKSFASGHTANAAAGLLLAALPVRALAENPSRRRAVFWVAAAAAALVAFGRIIAGAHFLSDVTCGFAIMFALECLGMRVAYPAGVQ